jgi:hypothetical protein
MSSRRIQPPQFFICDSLLTDAVCDVVYPTLIHVLRARPFRPSSHQTVHCFARLIICWIFFQVLEFSSETCKGCTWINHNVETRRRRHRRCRTSAQRPRLLLQEVLGLPLYVQTRTQLALRDVCAHTLDHRRILSAFSPDMPRSAVQANRA